jgi:hypothetical protein
MNFNDTRIVTTPAASAALYDFGYCGVGRGRVEVELMLVTLQSSSDGALVVAFLIIILLIWALSH